MRYSTVPDKRVGYPKCFFRKMMILRSWVGHDDHDDRPSHDIRDPVIFVLFFSSVSSGARRGPPNSAYKRMRVMVVPLQGARTGDPRTPQPAYTLQVLFTGRKSAVKCFRIGVIRGIDCKEALCG